MAPPATNTQLTRDLVLSLLPPLKDDPAVFRQVTDHIAREVKADVQGSSRMTWPEVESSIAGLARTARVRVQSDLAEGLEKGVKVLRAHGEKGQAAWEGDMPVKMSNLSQHVQFLLAMANQPTLKTHDFAYEYLHRQPLQIVDHDRILYDEIMQDPFDGDHWGEGYDSEVKEGWTDSDEGEDGDGDTASEKERIITPLRSKVSPSNMRGGVEDSGSEERLREAEEMMRRLEKGAYWKYGGEVVQPMKVGQGWREVSTGIDVASLAAALDEDAELGQKISGTQFQRELLFALSGRPGVMLDFDTNGSCFIISDHPTVTHYSPTAVNSILSDVQIRSTQTSLLRRYISQTLSPITTSTDLGPSKTAQAFAEACRGYIAKLDYWLASLELAFVRGVLPGERQICTPLSLRLGLDTRFGYILDCLSTVLPYATSASSGRSPDTILNALYSLLINTPTPTHRQELLEIFLVAATPLWDMLGDWLVRGMPIPRSLTDFDSQSEKERPLDPEFWIKRDQDVSWADEDFWEAAFLFAGNGEEERQSQPDWIDNTVLESVLEAGKARGLLRGLLGRDADYNEQLGLWRPLSSLLADMGYEGDIDLVDILSNYLKPICQLTTFQLRRTLDEECGLQAHLDAIDGLFYLKGYSVLQPWTEWLFSQVTSRKPWADFQILTSTFRESITRQGELWLNPHAIRIHTTKKLRSVSASNSDSDQDLISPETLSILKATYQVPFPLSQLFTSTSLDLRADVFIFLLQVNFAKSLLVATKGWEPHKSTRLDGDMVALFQIRQRLVWVINALWTWMTERVVELETEKYKARLDQTTSFGEMIKLELKHVRRMREFAFQHARTVETNEAVNTIIQLTATLHDLFITHFKSVVPTQLGDVRTTASPPPPPTTYIQGRSRRRRRLAETRQIKANHSDSDSGSGSDSDPELDAEAEGPNRTLGAVPSFRELSLQQRVKAMNTELGRAVGVLKQGVEELARDEEGGEVWGMLEFALEDWR